MSTHLKGNPKYQPKKTHRKQEGKLVATTVWVRKPQEGKNLVKPPRGKSTRGRVVGGGDVYSVQLKEAQSTSDPRRLAVLSQSNSPHVKLVVAMNRATPREVLGFLAHDGHSEVRKAVALSGKCPSSDLDFILDREVPAFVEYVRRRV